MSSEAACRRSCSSTRAVSATRFDEAAEFGWRLSVATGTRGRRGGKRVIAKCAFMSSYAARHPEYGALLDALPETDETHARTTL